MKKVYYKGEAYEFKAIGSTVGSRQFQLFRDNNPVLLVEESAFDKKSVVSMILHAYYENSAQRI